MRVKMSHAFAINTNRRVQHGAKWNEHHHVGRFEVHFEQMANPAHVLDRGKMERIAFASPDGECRLTLGDVKVTMVSANIEVVFVVLEYEAELEPESIVSHVYVLCRERHNLCVDGLPFSSWLAEHIPDNAGDGLASDVLQFVTFPDENPLSLCDSEGPTALCRSLISRQWSHERRATLVSLPQELNSSIDSCFAHGRGVVLAAGHEPHIVAGAMMVIVDLLFAAAEVRRIRNRIAARIDELRRGLDCEERDDEGTDLRRTISEVRQARLTLAVDVIPALTGVDTPDRVLDSIRETFAGALRINALVDGTQTLLSTLTQVIETFVAEQEMASAVRFEERQRQWQFSISVVSGLIVPFALLLSFFGTATQSDVHPSTSMWDFSRYWPMWALALGSVGAVLAVSWWRYWRWLRKAPERRRINDQVSLQGV